MISVTGTTVKGFTNCGSFLRNFKDTLSYSDTIYSNTANWNFDEYGANLKDYHTLISTYVTARRTAAKKDYTVANSYCDSNDCFSISITGSTFSHFGMLTEDETMASVTDESYGL